MRKINKNLRLQYTAQMPIRGIARSLGSSPSAIGEDIRRATWRG